MFLLKAYESMIGLSISYILSIMHTFVVEWFPTNKSTRILFPLNTTIVREREKKICNKLCENHASQSCGSILASFMFVDK